MQHTQLDDRRYPLSIRWFVIISILIFASTFICIFITAIAVDRSCSNAAADWLPTYPGAEVISEEYTWLRPFGIGDTTRILYTPDSRQDVLSWYAGNDRALEEKGYHRTDGHANLYWRLGSPAGGGTTIRLISQCAPALVLW